MALTPKNLFKIGGANPGLFIYVSPDAIATIGASAYFNAVVDTIHQTDVIIVISSSGSTGAVDVIYVNSANGVTPVTVVTTEGVTATSLSADGTSKEIALGQRLLAEAGSRAAAEGRTSDRVEDPISEQLEAEREQRELVEAAADKALKLVREGVSTEDGKPVDNERKDDDTAKAYVAKDKKEKGG